MTTTIRVMGQADPITITEDRPTLVELLAAAGRGLQPTVEVTRASDGRSITVGVAAVTIVEDDVPMTPETKKKPKP